MRSEYPVGLCLACVLDDERADEPADVFIEGTGYCKEHARAQVT